MKPIKPKVPKNKVFLEPTNQRQQEAQRRVLDALAYKRRTPYITLKDAAKRSGTTVATIRRYAPGVVQIRSGRLDIAPTDRIIRHLNFLTHKGYVEVAVRNSRDASRIAKYNNALRAYAMTGDAKALKPYVGKSLKAGGQVYAFVTDTLVLERLVRAGAVNALDIYATGGVA